MKRSIFGTTLSLVLIALVLCCTAGAQTTFLDENFDSVAGGTVPPAGWTKFMSGAGTADWRWDDPGGVIPVPPTGTFAGGVAGINSDNAGGVGHDATLQSPDLDLSGAGTLLLDWDHHLRPLTGTTVTVQIFDGVMYNVAFSQTGGSNIGTPGAPVTESFDVTTLAGGSGAANIQFRYQAGFDWYWFVDNVRLYEPPPYDLACTGISAPVIDPQGCIHTLTAAETVTVDLLNNGGVPLGGGELYRVFVDFDAVNVLTENVTVAVSIPVGAAFTYSTMGTVDMSATGTHDLTARAVLLSQSDSDTSNDEFNLNYTSPATAVQGFGYSEDFDSLGSFVTPFVNTPMPAGWDNAQDDAASLGTHPSPDWGARIPALGNGPVGDHTSGTGTYVVIEDSAFASGPGDIELRSPCLDTSGAVGTPTVSFWNASDEDSTQYPLEAITLNVDIIDVTNGGVVTTSFLAVDGDGSDIAPISAGNDASWRKIDIDVSSFAPSIIKVQFRVNNDNGSGGFYDDEALDDFLFVDAIAATGQAPQPGLAVFDLNNAVSSLGNPVASVDNGPYSASVTQGSALTFSWEGIANQPLSCIIGNLNVQSATFPGIGQTDIGGPGTDMFTGLPLNISALFDGIGYYNNPTGYPIDAFFVVGPAGSGGMALTMPNFALPPGVLTTFQCVMTDSVAPFFYISNAIELSIN